jgi:DNA-binding NtrC family response regulator
MKLSEYSRPDQRLQGVRVLVVEDEIMIALDVEATLADAGADVVGLCITLSEALAAAAATENLSVATLDIRLGKDTSETVAMLLAERGIPFIFYSGQRLPNEMRERWPLSLLLAKPADPSQLVEAVATAALSR